MDSSNAPFKSVNTQQLYQLPRQLIKCPPSIKNIEAFDKKTDLSSDDFLSAEWKGIDRQCMVNVALRIKQLETKNVNLSRGGTKTVTNILASNDSLFEVHISVWEPYAEELSGLEIGANYLFSNLYIRDPGIVMFGNTGYALGYRFGSDVRAIIKAQTPPPVIKTNNSGRKNLVVLN